MTNPATLEFGVQRRHRSFSGITVLAINMSMQYTANLNCCKNDSFQMKNCDNFLNSQNIDR